MEENKIGPLDVLELVSQISKNVLRYPFTLKEKVFWTGEPSFFFGLTDHPLDRYGGRS
jgi:hypothetical protein